MNHRRGFLKGYDEYFDPPLENKYECPICLLGLREPVQTPCGHRFCRGCILRSIRDAGLKCPLHNERLDEKQLNADNFARREVLNHPVFCRWKKLYECPWKGPLSNLEDHLKECDFVDVSCAKNCGEEFQRKDLKKHLEDDCPNRTISCIFCDEEVLWNNMENHFQDCPQYPLPCEKCGKENIPRNEMQYHKEKDCPRVELKCPLNFVGCPFEGLRPAVNEHVKENIFNHFMDLAKECGSLIRLPDYQAPKSRSRRTRGGVEAQEQASREVFLSYLETLCKEQQTEIEGLRSHANELTGAVERLERRLNDSHMRVETPLQELTLRVNLQEVKSFDLEGRVCNGSYIWRIENYRQRRQDAIDGIATALHSPTFYTSLPGYKLCLRINLNGVDSGVGKYIALFVYMVQGDYDSILEWPFTPGRINFAILDESEGTEFRQHISRELTAESNLLAFQKQTDASINTCYGYADFAPIEHIQESRYIKNNTMVVFIQVL